MLQEFWYQENNINFKIRFFYISESFSYPPADFVVKLARNLGLLIKTKQYNQPTCHPDRIFEEMIRHIIKKSARIDYCKPHQKLSLGHNSHEVLKVHLNKQIKK